MRPTKAGLLFSGPSAFPSNVHYTPITVGEKKNGCNEQSYQYDKAVPHGFDEIAQHIRKLDDPYDMLHASLSLPKNGSIQPRKSYGS